MRSLFDVNTLIALFDPEHLHHRLALAWWSQNRESGWASCALTENGFVRVISSPGYPRPRSLADALQVLSAQVAQPGHVFWHDNISITDPDVFDRNRILGPKQITDAFLLALAARNGGRLVTFDRGVPLAAVRGAEQRHLVVVGDAQRRS